MTKLVANENDQIGGGEAVAAGLCKLGPTKRNFRYCAFLLAVQTCQQQRFKNQVTRVRAS